VDEEANGMFAMGAETMELPMEVKIKFEQGDDGMSFGFVTFHTIEIPYMTCSIFNHSYKASGANAVDASGKLDCAEFINVAKDDALAWPQEVRRAYPSTVNARMESTIKPFVRKSLEVNNTFLQIFEEKLGLPGGALMERHKLDEFSGSETRVIKTPPSPQDKGQLIGSHTDFGSLVCPSP
jgi:isopenicillin N synthase-like dioxygenase